jgi:hypothetical protein
MSKNCERSSNTKQRDVLDGAGVWLAVRPLHMHIHVEGPL